jgi:hypothetical protein
MPTTSPSSSQHDHPSNPEDTTTNYTTRVARRPRRVRPPAARTAAAIIAAAALAMLAAACSSPSSVSGSPNSGRSANSPSAVGYSACMRSHSVPNFPDPTGTGGIPKESAQHLGVSDSQFTAAQQACQHLPDLWWVAHRQLAPAMLRGRRLSPGLGAARGERGAGIRPVHALPRGAGLARPHHRFRGAPCLQYPCAASGSTSGRRRDQRVRAPGARRLVAGVGVRP